MVKIVNLDRVGGKIATMVLVGQNKAPALFAETAAKTIRVLYSEVKMLNVPLRFFDH